MIKLDYHFPNVGGVFTCVSEAFLKKPFWDIDRTIKATKPDAGILIEYE